MSTTEPSTLTPPVVPSRSSRGSLSVPVSDEQQQEQEYIAPPSVEEEEISHEEVIEEVIEPIEVWESGTQLPDQTVAPNHYKWYKIIVPREKEDDICVVRIHKTVQSGTTNLFVNLPPRTTWPTESQHQWNPTKGILEGDCGEYLVAIQGAVSFSFEDDETITRSNEPAVFDLYIEWDILGEKEKEERKKTRDQYTREKSSSVWSSSYASEFQSKYKQQQEEYEQEQQERELNQQQARVINLDGTPVVKDFKLGATLTSTGVSVVKTVEEITSGKQFALKIVDKEEASAAGITTEQLNSQMQILKSLQNFSGVACLKTYYDLPAVFCIVLELCGKEILQGHNMYSESEARSIIKQVLHIAGHLHSAGIIHRGFIPENILYANEQSKEVKLVGFNFALLVSEVQSARSVPFPSFQAPELIQQETFGTEVDMWQIGILTYILLSGKHPFDDNNTMRMYSKIRQGKYDFPSESWQGISEQAKDFVKSLLCVAVSSRLKADAALQHPWIKAA